MATKAVRKNDGPTVGDIFARTESTAAIIKTGRSILFSWFDTPPSHEDQVSMARKVLTPNVPWRTPAKGAAELELLLFRSGALS